MPPVASSTGLTITNPLVKYRALLATNRIRPDPAQHRLALQLQKLYYRLKDYHPQLEYRHRLDQISRTVDAASETQSQHDAEQGHVPYQRIPFSSLWRDGSGDPILALTRTVPIQHSALSINSPKGMLLYGEVGRGKSMLLDLFADSLPSRKKKRWHFNTFMLETFRRLEQLRMQRSSLPIQLRGLEQEHSVLALAKDTIITSPILFLDEFQLPDRVTSKILNSFLTSFFHLGGVLIATSNRMPDELAKAAGVEYAPQPSGLGSVFGWSRKRTEAERAASTDFGAFLDVLKARCEIWEMEGDRDWRRDDMVPDLSEKKLYDAVGMENVAQTGPTATTVAITQVDRSDKDNRSNKQPRHYRLIPSTFPNDQETAVSEAEWSNKIASLLAESHPTATSPTWSPSYLSVYGRKVPVPASSPTGYTLWNFADLCGTYLGPADYISLASTYHTLILDSVPILTLMHKNEARRFITLLDALYESKCRLLMRAEAPPDALFFPETQNPARIVEDATGDGVYQETLAEIYQDQTSPFRPNISSYREDSSTGLTQSLLNPKLRSVLADEDADFGPVYGNGRGHGASTGLEEMEKRQRRDEGRAGPDFTQTATLTGEDERFAYKRARSRIWEMCGERWWSERPADQVGEWWRPVALESRFWESQLPATTAKERVSEETVMVDGSHDGRQRRADQHIGGGPDEDGLFRHGASPYRTRTDPPPKFGWQHAWGMVTWGRKAGEWGKGVEGRREKAGKGEK
ncbi:hypothetical protein EPUS_01375 [Endocarpon pusillum Z07020]|uniref:AAA+ ATPase domain-containing protein n=1 Tax=Endocarpon pusillum (strain Z07020 / HMAS-L-300199) TaxID=1263415 RepID=U1GEI8_ENDPU|nr:uncharacterized protein EPUS_01375 [Endocarpon pusillum Z07020]ERF76042.1 hypothetical protein EPUS_01375 [Endocarpon pusillum Z07020]